MGSMLTKLRKVKSAQVKRFRRKRSYRHYEMTYKLKEIVDNWKLTKKEMRKLHQRFLEFDEDHSGTIGHKEFFAFVHEKKSHFLELMFSMIATNNTELDFAAWLKAVFAFCLTTEDEMREQVFYMFDTNHNGYWDLSELNHFLVTVHGDNPIFPGKVVAALTEQNLLQHGKLSFDDFMESVRKFPMLVWPVFRVQHRVRKRTMGVKFFKDIDRRICLTYQNNEANRFLKSKWARRMETFQLYCCSWKCCLPKEGSGTRVPTTQSEIAKRKQDLQKMHFANARRTANANVANMYQPLPNRAWHTEEDHEIERDVLQVNAKPLGKKDLVEPPFVVTAVDEDGAEHELSESDSSDGSIGEVEESEYSDLYSSDDEEDESSKLSFLVRGR